jgi:hypothetical protein
MQGNGPKTSKYNVKPTSQYNSILLNTVKPVLRGHLWGKENVALYSVTIKQLNVSISLSYLNTQRYKVQVNLPMRSPLIKLKLLL